VDVVAGEPADRAAVERFLRTHHSLRVARRGELVDSLDHPALLAWEGDELVGVATYVVGVGDCELLTLHAATRHVGVGSALVAGVREVALAAGCDRLWLVTTNDNVDALRFYQRRGFRLARLRPGAVDESRATLKPEISSTGDYGIPLRDELELEMPLLGGSSDDVGTSLS
jgi:ribosomal protein S18 acetylase RimI-like enzyme